MNCVVCSQMGSAYRLVGEDTMGICEQCVAEHLTADVDTDTCLYCERAGEYDLVEDAGAVPGADATTEYEAVTTGVVCRDHVVDLRSEG